MPEIQTDSSGQSFVEVPNGWAPGEYIRITHVDRTEEKVGPVIRIQRRIEGKRPDRGPEMAVTGVLYFVEGLMSLLVAEGHEM